MFQTIIFLLTTVGIISVQSSNITRDGSSNSTLNNNGPIWTAQFEKCDINLKMNEILRINLTIAHIDPMWSDDFYFKLTNENPSLATVNKTIKAAEVVNKIDRMWSGNFTLTALFLGRDRIFVELHRPNFDVEKSRESMKIVISRNISAIDNAFTAFVALFVTIIYINFGAALDLNAMKEILIRPIGPAIGFLGQFLIMPVLSFLIGYLLFPEMIELRLGLFFTGVSPGGGTSNIFTVILNGNLDLSIIMTAVSNIAALGMMPLWIFTLGALIFFDGNFAVPYDKIAIFSISLVLPLGIGICLQKCSPKFANKISKSLKPISIGLILFITIFASFMNSYLFKLFSWKIILATAALPWFGYLFGWIMAFILRQSAKDALTIAIETGIQNTGIAIFMLNFTLPQPQADMTSAVPVACALMTPIPLMLLSLVKKYICHRENDVKSQTMNSTDNKHRIGENAINLNKNVSVSEMDNNSAKLDL